MDKGDLGGIPMVEEGTGICKNEESSDNYSSYPFLSFSLEPYDGINE